MITVRLWCVALLGTVASCSALPPSCASGETRALQDTLYFGTGKPAGGVVTDLEWSAFLEAEVTPRFPEGLTVFEADGQWLGENGSVVQEQSYVLQLVHAGGTDNDSAVNGIAAAYKQQFGQEAVLRVRTAACMAL